MKLSATEVWSYVSNCPICQCGLPRVHASALSGEHAYWASAADSIELGWSDKRVMEAISAEGDEDLLDPEDFATDLDSPEPPASHEQELLEQAPSPAEQLAEVMPQIDGPDEANEPKPGC